MRAERCTTGRARRAGCGVVLAILVGLVIPLGCDRASTVSEDDEQQAMPVASTVDRGPVRLTVTADRSKISIAERLTLTVEVVAEAGIEVKLPDFGVALNEFQIRDYREAPVEQTDDSHRRYVAEYDLDIFLSGEYSVPAITAQYRDLRGEASGSAAESEPMAELATEPFTIEVTSLLEGEFDPADFRDVKDVATLPADRNWGWLAWVGGAVGAIALAIVAIVLWRRRRKSPRTIVIPPHDWAFQQLRALADAKLVEDGRVKEFYYRLSEIVRTYIELRFGLMAPERTTEEFLAEMGVTHALPGEYQPALRDFLEACDMVKYARYQPGVAEIEQVFNTARDFVDRTKSPAMPQEVAA